VKFTPLEDLVRHLRVEVLRLLMSGGLADFMLSDEWRHEKSYWLPHLGVILRVREIRIM
jgi:hypothetical protein